MKRKTVDSYCFIIISKCYDFHVLQFTFSIQSKVILGQYDLLEHVKQDNTLNSNIIIICRYLLFLIYDLSKADRSLNINLPINCRFE